MKFKNFSIVLCFILLLSNFLFTQENRDQELEFQKKRALLKFYAYRGYHMDKKFSEEMKRLAEDMDIKTKMEIYEERKKTGSYFISITSLLFPPFGMLGFGSGIQGDIIGCVIEAGTLIITPLTVIILANPLYSVIKDQKSRSFWIITLLMVGPALSYMFSITLPVVHEYYYNSNLKNVLGIKEDIKVSFLTFPANNEDNNFSFRKNNNDMLLNINIMEIRF